MDRMPAITKRFADAAAPGRGVQKRRTSIGRHGAPWTPLAARNKALEYLCAVKGGRDPLAERAALERPPDCSRVSAVVEQWLKRDQAGNRLAR